MKDENKHKIEIRKTSQPCTHPYMYSTTGQSSVPRTTMDNNMKLTEHIDTVSNKFKAILARFALIKIKIP